MEWDRDFRNNPMHIQLTFLQQARQECCCKKTRYLYEKDEIGHLYVTGINLKNAQDLNIKSEERISRIKHISGNSPLS